METDPRDGFLDSLVHNRFFHSVLWICGGCLWLVALRSNPPQPDFPPMKSLTLQRTQVDGQRRFAWIDGRRVKPGQFLQTEQGIFQVQQIEPGCVRLQRGQHGIQLELPKPGHFESNPSSIAAAGW